MAGYSESFPLPAAQYIAPQNSTIIYLYSLLETPLRTTNQPFPETPHHGALTLTLTLIMLTCLWLILKIDSYSTIEFNQFFTKDTSMIFFSFGHPPQMNLTFQDHLNKAHSTIKFSFETSTVNVPFLDVSITKEDNCCHVKPYFKCTNTFSYMMGQSYHPPSVFKRITRGENIRILKKYSKKQDYVDTMTSLKRRFKERKIPHKYVEYLLAPHENRHLFFEKQRNRDEKNIPFVSSYNSNNILSEN